MQAPSAAMPEYYVNPVFTPASSIISIPVAIQPSFLENIINTQVADLMYENDSITIIPGISNARLSVYRASDVHIGLLGDELHYKIPLRLAVRFGIGVNAAGIRMHQYQDIEAAIALRMRSAISVNPDWTLTTQTVIDGYDWLSSPVIKVAGLSVPFGPVADLVLGALKGRLGKIVDKSVRENLDLKKIILPYWEQIQRPLLLNDSLGLWLTLAPESLSMTRLQGHSGYLTSSIGLKAVVQTYWGIPDQPDSIVPLPDITVIPDIQAGFILNLYSEMAYAQAQHLSRQMLRGRTFEVGGKKIGVEDIWVNGDSGRIRIDAALSGAYKGTVTLMGRPSFDTISCVFSVENVVFDMHTRNVLLSTARWMLNGVLQKKIAESLVIPLERELSRSREIINTSLCAFKPVDYITFIGSVDSLRVRGFTLTGDAVRVAVHAQGKLGIKFERLLQIF